MLRIATISTAKRLSAVVSTTALGTIVYACCNSNSTSDISYCSYTRSNSLRLKDQIDLSIVSKSHGQTSDNPKNGEKPVGLPSQDIENQEKGQNIMEKILPISQASLRAMRLISTVVMIIIEYKLDSFKQMVNEAIETSGYEDIVGTVREDLKRQKLERNVQEKLKELQNTQKRYTQPTKNGQSNESKREELRKDVHDAAEMLGQAEHELSEYIHENEHLVGKSTGVHARAAMRLRDLCRYNGGTYIKVGQHVANLDHLLPDDYITILHELFGSCPVSSYEDVREVIKEELGAYPEDVFQQFEKEPIASASLAQVHIAKEKETGRKLAVKVQHRGLRETSKGDLLALETVVRLVDSLFDEFKFGWTVDEIAPNLPKELDFKHEGKNAEKAAEHIRNTGLNCVIPKVHWKHTTSRVLCMDYEEGYSVTDTVAMDNCNLNKSELSSLISSVFQAQVFESGFVHCDPHPANVLWRKMKNGKSQLILLDHGLYKQIDDEFRVNYANLWKGLLIADITEIKAACSRIGIDDMYPLLSAMLMSRPFDEVIERSKTKSFSTSKKIDTKSDAAMIRGYAQQYIGEIIKLLDKVPRQMLLLFKMNDCLRHIDHVLGSNPTKNLIISGKYAVNASFKEKLKKDKNTINRFRQWISFMMVISKIKIYEVVQWLTHCRKSAIGI